MASDSMFTNLQKALLQPESLWREEVFREMDIQPFLQRVVFPVIFGVAVLSAVLTKLFGYHIPMLGVIYPSWSDMLIRMVGSIVMYMISIVVAGWIAAYLAGMFGGINDMRKAIAMIFWISIPSMAGQILGTLPYVGWLIALGLGLYSLVLLYKAIPLFLKVPLHERVKHFILFLIGTLVFSMVLGMTLGRLFTPKDMIQNMQPDILKQVTPPSVHNSIETPTSSKPANPVEGYVDAMSKGDYNQDVITDTADDTFTPPADGRLTKAQVEQFIRFAQKVKVVEKEQAEKLKEKYEGKEKSEDFSISDIFNGLKDFSNLATLEMKVVKTNGGNWAEYQWVKDRIREAYFTPSLNETTQYNAELLKGHEEVIKNIL